MAQPTVLDAGDLCGAVRPELKDGELDEGQDAFAGEHLRQALRKQGVCVLNLSPHVSEKLREKLREGCCQPGEEAPASSQAFFLLESLARSCFFVRLCLCSKMLDTCFGFYDTFKHYYPSAAGHIADSHLEVSCLRPSAADGEPLHAPAPQLFSAEGVTSEGFATLLFPCEGSSEEVFQNWTSWLQVQLPGCKWADIELGPNQVALVLGRGAVQVSDGRLFSPLYRCVSDSMGCTGQYVLSYTLGGNERRRRPSPQPRPAALPPAPQPAPTPPAVPRPRLAEEAGRGQPESNSPEHIRYEVLACGARFDIIDTIVPKHGNVGVVFEPDPRKGVELTTFLPEQIAVHQRGPSLKVDCYHGPMTGKQALADFVEKRTDILFVSAPLPQGVRRDDVCWALHTRLPRSPGDLDQWAGRDRRHCVNLVSCALVENLRREGITVEVEKSLKFLNKKESYCLEGDSRQPWSQWRLFRNKLNARKALYERKRKWCILGA